DEKERQLSKHNDRLRLDDLQDGLMNRPTLLRHVPSSGVFFASASLEDQIGCTDRIELFRKFGEEMLIAQLERGISCGVSTPIGYATSGSSEISVLSLGSQIVQRLLNAIFHIYF